MKEVIILECSEFDRPEELAKIAGIAIVAEQPLALLWADGVLFTYTLLMSDSTEMFQEALKGKVHWSNVTFTLMPQFREVIETKGLTIPVIDASRNEMFVSVAKWLKRRSKKDGS